MSNFDPRQRTRVSPSLQALNSVFAIPLENAAALVIQLTNQGTASLGAGVFNFEASVDSTDGTDGTWGLVPGSRVGNPNQATTPEVSPAIAAGAAQGWFYELDVSAYRWFRIRTSVAGSANSQPVFKIGLSNNAAPATVSVTGTVAMSTEPSIAFVPQGSFYNSAATTNLTNVRNSAATLGAISVSNTGAATRYLKLYNKASAPVLATDIPVMVLIIPAGTDKNYTFAPKGIRFSAGLSFAMVGGAANADATAIGASEVKAGFAWF